jgi:hypothetical protein
MRDKSGRGNDATAPSDPARPILRARYNQITYSEAITTSPWSEYNSGNGAILSAIASPTGTVTAIGLNDTSGGFYGVERSITIAGSTQYTFSVSVKQGTSTSGFSVWLIGNNSNTYFQNTISWTAGVPTASGWTATNQDNGWWRISYTFSSASATSIAVYFLPTPTVLADTGSAYFWGADLRVTNDALNQPAYQRVAAATDYDTTGFLPYLEFNGSTWSMSTSAIDFSATDKMTVFAGVRKLTTGDHIIAELSANASSGANPGSFFIVNPTSARWYFLLRGSSSIVTYEPQTYTAPITSVLAVSMDLSQSTIAQQLLPRVNGVLEQENSGGSNAGTGNFGNYPFFIGSRNNASVFFNGRLTSLIIRGAASSAAEIAATEAWVNGKTAAY